MLKQRIPSFVGVNLPFRSVFRFLCLTNSVLSIRLVIVPDRILYLRYYYCFVEILCLINCFQDEICAAIESRWDYSTFVPFDMVSSFNTIPIYLVFLSIKISI